MTDRRDPLLTSQARDVAASYGRRLMVLCSHAVVILVLCLPVDSLAISRVLADDEDDVPAAPAERLVIRRGQPIFLRGQPVDRIALDQVQIQQIAIQQIPIADGQILKVAVFIGGVEHFQKDRKSVV